jgi:hypothetical protein
MFVVIFDTIEQAKANIEAANQRNAAEAAEAEEREKTAAAQAAQLQAKLAQVGCGCCGFAVDNRVIDINLLYACVGAH